VSPCQPFPLPLDLFPGVCPPDKGLRLARLVFFPLPFSILPVSSRPIDGPTNIANSPTFLALAPGHSFFGNLSFAVQWLTTEYRQPPQSHLVTPFAFLLCQADSTGFCFECAPLFACSLLFVGLHSNGPSEHISVLRSPLFPRPTGGFFFFFFPFPVSVRWLDGRPFLPIAFLGIWRLTLTPFSPLSHISFCNPGFCQHCFSPVYGDSGFAPQFFDYFLSDAPNKGSVPAFFFSSLWLFFQPWTVFSAFPAPFCCLTLRRSALFRS